MKRDGRIVKRLGVAGALIALIVAGAMAVRAADPQPVYRVAADPGVGEGVLRQAIDPLFGDGAAGGTRALVILRDGRIIAEGYAPGFGPNSKLLGWSIAKSVTAVLVGLMVSDGRLALDAPVPVKAWSQPGDPRGRITLRQLLTMTSGLDHSEDADPIASADTNRMFFTDGAADMGRFAESQPVADPPGTVFSYSSGNTMILADLMTRQLTGSEDPDVRRQAMETFIEGRLKQTAGLPSLTPEYDMRGTMIGGGFLHMTARDYARFGELLRNHGRGPAGHQIVAEKWIAFMRAPSALNPAYGGHLWLNRTSGQSALMPDEAPASLFGCVGHNGQYILVAPRQRLTIVRLGLSPQKAQRMAVKSALARLIALFPA